MSKNHGRHAYQALRVPSWMLKWVFLQCLKPGRARLTGPSAGLLVVLICSETTLKKSLELWQEWLRELRPQLLVHVFGALVGALKVSDNHACQGFGHLRTSKIDCEVLDKRACQGFGHAQNTCDCSQGRPRSAGKACLSGFQTCQERLQWRQR